MHDFVIIIPAGFSKITYLQSRVYQYINPIPYSVRDVRYLDQLELGKL